MAKRYESEAHVVIGGEEIPVYARFDVFTDSGIKQWHGTLGSSEPGLGYKLVTADRVRLCMPDGKEGAIVATHADGGELVPFTGSGPSPT
ncbi:hypothetical protein [Streptomyces sp. BA2]|uniref:hypothetical protein n=1 Tax=Streptomyces sp. BA2 TaxID=436595 RepID=UPI00132685EE|nr:hypothetical protein [Streptomyces sp. BA2]MWA08714.1 hypothetical protein [Streptomyces sp. BA2]